ncbi:hypothetical protein GCM10022393_36350 [Aquimarina addita]|uniref:Uncharacterized protein n=1 Tax=Aquimarina addita TaxID=870485 RepID=A0ABP6URT8_9FLAO
MPVSNYTDSSGGARRLKYSDVEGNNWSYRESKISIYGNPSIDKNSKTVISGSKE